MNKHDCLNWWVYLCVGDAVLNGDISLPNESQYIICWAERNGQNRGRKVTKSRWYAFQIYGSKNAYDGQGLPWTHGSFAKGKAIIHKGSVIRSNGDSDCIKVALGFCIKNGNLK